MAFKINTLLGAIKECDVKDQAVYGRCRKGGCLYESQTFRQADLRKMQNHQKKRKRQSYLRES